MRQFLTSAETCRREGGTNTPIDKTPRVIPVIGGLGAAILWASGTVAGSRSARRADPSACLAWAMIGGMIVCLPGLFITGVPKNLTAHSAVWLGLAGTGNVAGLLVLYKAMRIGSVSLLSALGSTEGAIAATLAAIAGEHLGLGLVGAISLAVVGVLIVAWPPREASVHMQLSRRSIALGAAATVLFGVSLFATGKAAATLPVAWAATPPRLVGTLVLAPAMLAQGRIRIPRIVWRTVTITALAEVFGFMSFVWGSQHGIAVAAVLASQFSVFCAIFAWVLFHEKLSHRQIFGVVVTAIAVGLVSGLTG